MNSSLTNLKNHLVCFGAAALLAMSVSAAKAQILLDVQINGDVATITATGSAPVFLDPSQTTATTPIFNGIDLENFFSSTDLDVSFHNATSSSLTTPAEAAGDGLTLQQYSVDFATGTPVDLNLSTQGPSDNLTFTAGDAAFTGTMTINLASFPSVNSSGQILAGFEGSSDGVIGTWQVVSAPEPSVVWLVFAGLSFVALARRCIFRSAR